MSFQADLERFNEKYPVRTMKVNGLTFNYRLGGKGDKTIVLLVGGLGISDALCGHFDAFAESFAVLTFDYPDETCSNSVLADGIAGLINALELKNVFLVGQSYVGLLAQVITKRHPEMVKGLVLSNTGCLDSDMDEEAMKAMLQMPKRLRKYVWLVRIFPISILKKVLIKRTEKRSNQVPSEENRYMADLFRYCYSRLTRRHELKMCSLIIDLTNERGIKKDDFSHLDKKVLLLLSDDDDTFGDPVKKALVGMMPNPVVNTGICGGHLALVTNRELYIRTVTEFLNGIEL